MKTKTFIIILGICAVIWGGIGYFSKYSSAVWSTYTNETYGYELKLPSNVRPLTDTLTDTGYPDRKLVLADSKANNIFVTKDPSLLLCCEVAELSIFFDLTGNAQETQNRYYAKYKTPGEPVVRRVAKLGGLDVLELAGAGDKETPYRIIFVQRNGGTLVIEQNFRDEFLDRVLSTFKFK